MIWMFVGLRVCCSVDSSVDLITMEHPCSGRGVCKCVLVQMKWALRKVHRTYAAGKREESQLNWIPLCQAANRHNTLCDWCLTYVLLLLLLCMGCVPVDDVYLYMHVICENALNDMANRVTVMASLWHEMTSSPERHCQTTAIMRCIHTNTLTPAKMLKDKPYSLMRLRSSCVCVHLFRIVSCCSQNINISPLAIYIIKPKSIDERVEITRPKDNGAELERQRERAGEMEQQQQQQRQEHRNNDAYNCS